MSRSSSIPLQRGRIFGANLTNALRSPTPTPSDLGQESVLPCLKGAEFGGFQTEALSLPPLKRHKTEQQGGSDEEAGVRMKMLLSREAWEGVNGVGKGGYPTRVCGGAPSPPSSLRTVLDKEAFKRQIYPFKMPPLLGKSGAYAMALKHSMDPLDALASRRGGAASGDAPQTQALGWGAMSRFEWANESTHLCQSAGAVHRLWQRTNTREGKECSDSDELEDASPIHELSQQPPTFFSPPTNSPPNGKRGAESRVQKDWSPIVCKEALEVFTDTFNSVYNF